MNSNIGEDVPSISTEFILRHHYRTLRVTSMIHEVDAAADRQISLHGGVLLQLCPIPWQVSRTCGGNPAITGSVCTFGSHGTGNRRWEKQTNPKTKHCRQSTKLEEVSEHAGNLEELVFLALLESHERPRRLLLILSIGEDTPHSLLRLHVARFLEEPHQCVLVDVLENIGHGFLAVRRVKPVAVDRRTHSAAF